MTKMFKVGALLTGITLPMLVNCSAVQDAQNAACCKEYPADPGGVAAKFDANLKGQVSTFVQATADLTAVANAAAIDVAVACQNIALDLGATANQDIPAANPKKGVTDADRVKFWCGQASAKIKEGMTATGAATLTVTFVPPKCTASVKAKVDCQAKCTVDGKCDIKVNPPKCTGGKLEINCKGGCDVSATAPKIDCEGSCSVDCEGSCEAQGSVAVNCNGTCEGNCSVAPASDGTCSGTCSGKCNVKAGASVKCQGTCHGQCNAKCTATPGQVSVRCSGSCDAEYEPISCEGGKLEGGCSIEAKCDANCDASVSAKAECTEPKLAIVAGGSITVGKEGLFNTLVASLETNLPKLIVVVKARGQGFADQLAAVVQVGVDISGQATLTLPATSCLVAIGSDAGVAVENFTATLQGSVDVLGSVGVK